MSAVAPPVDVASSCPQDAVLASGAPDATLFAAAASPGVRGEWCERYDAHGRATRVGRYRERYANGRLRLEARYVDGRLEGPIVAHDEEGVVFLRGHLVDGSWAGAFAMYDESGSPWFEANYVEGRLDGVVLMRHADGALAAEARYAKGREHGLARSFFATPHGGGLLSEVRIVDDAPAGAPRLFDDEGTLLAPLASDHPLFATVERPAPSEALAGRPAPDDAPSTPPVAAIITP